MKDNSYPDAEKMVTELNDTGVETFTFVHSNCINTWIQKDRYIVHTNTFYEDWKEAENMGQTLKGHLATIGINCNRCKPLTLKPSN